MCDDGLRVVVLDNGSGAIKAGFAGDDKPKSFFPISGIPETGCVTIGSKVGDKSQSKRGVTSIQYPIERGLVTNWDDMEKIWDYVLYNQLSAAPEEHLAHLTEITHNTRNNREKTIEIMFESFNFPSMYISDQSVLALFSTGRFTGIVLDIGEGVNNTVPIYEGHAIHHAVNSSSLAGRDLTDYLNQELTRRGLFTDSTGYETTREIKEKLSVCPQTNPSSSELQKSYTTTNGAITVGVEGTLCPEILFQPSILGRKEPAVQDGVYQSILKCDIDIRRDLYPNIVLSGGTTMFDGFPERLHQEILNTINSTSIRIKILAPQGRRFSTWLGGSILSSVAFFQKMWIDRQEYDEVGSIIVHRKCF
eukprot:TRINITY_DN4812_c0_g3_i1.p1 TRINITY_DN4812_c0_g3~~TRINITY_DN4812_c0_g3_i1.p1  ORF type:complete len:363 (+),score=47.89 TRINITY_DN4812_c0_g3_i1:18-1106(+)